jgi:hypothetical protein
MADEPADWDAAAVDRVVGDEPAPELAANTAEE